MRHPFPNQDGFITTPLKFNPRLQVVTHTCMFIIHVYSKERKTAVTHTHNTEINYLYTRDYSHIQIHSLKKKKT